MVTEVSSEHSLKANSLMVWTESGITIEVRLEHPEKAPCSMVWTESGMVTEVNSELEDKKHFICSSSSVSSISRHTDDRRIVR